MSTRDVQGHVREVYGVDISPDLVSDITDAILPELKAWQSRPLDNVSVLGTTRKGACGTGTREWTQALNAFTIAFLNRLAN